MARTAKIACLTLLVALTAAGCLVKETDHTLALDTGGGLTWIILERTVHAVADSAEAREREEFEYLMAARTGRNTAAQALAALGGTDIRTTVVRDDWPFAVLTEGRFADLGATFQRFLDATGVPGESVLERQDGRITWRLTAYPDDADEERPSPVDEQTGEAVASLLERTWTLALRAGRFVDAVGLTIDSGGRTARMEDPEEAANRAKSDPDKAIRISLSWTPEQ